MISAQRPQPGLALENDTMDEEAPETTARATAVVQQAMALDRLVHEPARLAILAVLNSADEVDFKFLEAATGLTKGNLSRHSSKLEDAGYITIRKYFKGKVPATRYRITPAGKDAFTAYWERIAALQRSIPTPAPASD